VESVAATPKNLWAQLEIAPPPEPGLAPANVAYLRYPAGEGVFPSSKWRPGDVLRASFPLRIPPSWAGQTALLALPFPHATPAPAAVAGLWLGAEGRGFVGGEGALGPP